MLRFLAQMNQIEMKLYLVCYYSEGSERVKFYFSRSEFFLHTRLRYSLFFQLALNFDILNKNIPDFTLQNFVSEAHGSVDNTQYLI